MINNKYLNLLEKQDSLSLYIHIPFCNTKCYYCAFYSESSKCWDEVKVDSYLSKLKKEIKVLKSYYNKPYDTVFIGGGNPGVLGYKRLRELLIEIGLSKETSFEINPESLTLEYINLFKEGLATRISVGIQSFDDKILELLGRNARYNDNIRALKIIRNLDSLKIDLKNNYFINNNLITEKEYLSLNTSIKYSFDLMSSLPTQKKEDSIKDIDTLLKYTNLKHLSLYCLSVEEGTHLYNLVKDKKINKNDDLFEKDLLEKLWLYLEKKGFEHYEVSNFTKDNNKCLHNLRYWDLSPYISLGSSSASTLFDENTLIRLTNTSSINSYIKSDLFNEYEVEELSKSEYLDEYLIVTLRNNRGLNFSALKTHFQIEKDIVIKAFNTLGDNLYKISGDFLHLTEEGFLLLDTIILDISVFLDKYL